MRASLFSLARCFRSQGFCFNLFFSRCFFSSWICCGVFSSFFPSPSNTESSLGADSHDPWISHDPKGKLKPLGISMGKMMGKINGNATWLCFCKSVTWLACSAPSSACVSNIARTPSHGKVPDRWSRGSSKTSSQSEGRRSSIILSLKPILCESDFGTSKIIEMIWISHPEHVKPFNGTHEYMDKLRCILRRISVLYCCTIWYVHQTPNKHLRIPHDF